MKRIVLVRHGKPLMDTDNRPEDRIGLDAVPGLIHQYNTASLDSTVPPPQQLIEVTRSTQQFVCSDLRRALESAQWLCVDDNIDNLISNALFTEMALPHFAIRMIKLRLQSWLVLYRLAWACGCNGNVESVKQAAARAALAASRLEQLVERHNDIALVGHGICNRMIARHLRSRGWRKQRTQSTSGYWQYSVYTLQTTL